MSLNGFATGEELVGNPAVARMEKKLQSAQRPQRTPLCGIPPLAGPVENHGQDAHATPFPTGGTLCGLCVLGFSIRMRKTPALAMTFAPQSEGLHHSEIFYLHRS